MNNPVLETIANRRSIRAFDGTPLTAEEKETILTAAMRAPTAGNLMLYTIIEVEDQAIKDRLAITCDHQPFIAKSPYVLLFVADYQRWSDYFNYCGVEQRCLELNGSPRKLGVGDLMLAVSDTLIAAQTAVLAAESIGVSSCYIGDVSENYEIHRELFALPRYCFPAAMLCFGHAHPNVANRPLSQRFAKELIVHKNQYQRADEAALASMGDGREPADGKYPLGAQNYGQYVYLKKFTAEFSFEMTRSVKEYLKNWE